MNSLQPPVHVNISSLTIVKIILVVLGLLFLWFIRDIIAVVFVAWILASALDPLIDRMQRAKIPRAIGILSVYVVFLSILTAILAVLVPSVARELSAIGHEFPEYYASIKNGFAGLQSASGDFGIIGTLQDALDSIVHSVTSFSGGVYSAISSVFGGFVALVGVLVIAFYMTVEEDSIKKFIQSIAPINYQPYIIKKINQIHDKLSSWLWGQLLLMVFVGTLTGLALWMLGIKYALVLGILAGLTEIIPIVGPIVAAIPAVFFSLSDILETPYKPLIIVVLFVVIQQVENQILVPRVMKKATGVNPIVVIISLLIGYKLGGFVGIILAVPLVTILSIFLDDFFAERRNEQNRLET